MGVGHLDAEQTDKVSRAEAGRRQGAKEGGGVGPEVR